MCTSPQKIRGPSASALGTEGAPAGVRTARPPAKVAAWARFAGRNRDRHTVGDDQRTVRCRITYLLLGILARRLFSQVLVSWGRVMRYGCYNSRAPALLAGGVVAGSDGCPLVAPSRLADASFALHLAAVGRAVPLPAIAAGTDDHQSAAACAVEHPVALVDDRAPATEDWTPGPPPAILTSSLVIALAVTQKPRPLRQRPGLRFVSGGPVLPHGLVAGHVIIGHAGDG